jgi:hypothetical protein
LTTILSRVFGNLTGDFASAGGFSYEIGVNPDDDD